jgi:Zn-dependent M28 family amino/carboxypeptidase
VKNKSIAVYITMIGLLFVVVTGWYAFAFLSQPEPDSLPTDVPPIGTNTHTEIIPSLTQPPQVTPTPDPVSFDGQRAYEDVIAQVAFGARIPGLEGHVNVQEWVREELEEAGWQVEVQESEAMGHPIQNVVAKRGNESPQIILGAHYDTRMFADNDPDPANHSQPAPGANDGASGVAVLLELARVLPEDTVPVWLVFFDAEDNGRIAGWDWILGSREFVRLNPVRPRAVVIVDMVGDADLKIYKEGYSDPALTDEIWAVAANIENDTVFVPEKKHRIIDDHLPFLQAGIPAVDIIDIEYPYWHTVQDTPDKVSAKSLQAVGETLLTWIMGQNVQP